MKFSHIAIAMLCIGTISCGAKNGANEATSSVDSTSVSTTKLTDVVFNADSAYSYVKAQVDCGPRIPGTKGHDKCQRYLIDQLRRFGADSIIEQRTNVTTYRNDVYHICNIMGCYNTSATKRVLLLAHWDTRPWADNDSRENRDKPVPGANDGGSGVGVLLEVARQLGMKSPQIGVDILFVDAEDSGHSSGWGDGGDSWALGTQYWAQNMPYTSANRPVYGILLDMVGGQDAKFHREYYSNEYAPQILDKVWSIAARSGYEERFRNVASGAVMDDHYYVNQAGIPCIDIIECDNPITKNFHPSWHTINDDMSVIDRQSLREVGQTVINTIYTEPIN